MTAAAALDVLVADDEPHALSALEALVHADEGLRLVASCADGASALEAAAKHRPDLMVLDVRMPGLTGLEVVAALPADVRPLVVFATAHDDHAVEAFDLHAVDYLLKPFDDERFRRALERARERRRDEGPEPGRTRIAGVIEEGGGERIAIPREGRVTLVPFGDLEWVEAADQYVRLHLMDGREELMRASMGHLEKRLSSATSQRFMRVHRSAIVRVDRIRELRAGGSGTGRLTLAGGQEVPVSRTRWALVKRSFGPG